MTVGRRVTGKPRTGTALGRVGGCAARKSSSPTGSMHAQEFTASLTSPISADYTPIDLGTRGGGSSWVVDINEVGQIVKGRPTTAAKRQASLREIR